MATVEGALSINAQLAKEAAHKLAASRQKIFDALRTYLQPEYQEKKDAGIRTTIVPGIYSCKDHVFSTNGEETVEIRVGENIRDAGQYTESIGDVIICSHRTGIIYEDPEYIEIIEDPEYAGVQRRVPSTSTRFQERLQGLIKAQVEKAAILDRDAAVLAVEPTPPLASVAPPTIR